MTRPVRQGEPLDRWLGQFIPHLSVDLVVFGFHGADLKLLLLKWKGRNIWALPGGYVGQRQSLDDAAQEVLRQRTGMRRLHLLQFHAFGGLHRKEACGRDVFATTFTNVRRDHWVIKRVVSIGYYALVDFQEVRPKADFYSDSCAWHALDDHPPLAFDHGRIVTRALEALRAGLEVPGAGADLLPERFTMPELQRLHEAVLGRRLDRRNFQKRMLDGGGIERLGERRHGGAHRAPYLYRFTARPEHPDF
jgi:ADP-ribose pyrophosphatase YjhB (NUDIX family)